jgi:hypothetical protein
MDYDLWFITNVYVVGDPKVNPVSYSGIYVYLYGRQGVAPSFPLNEARSNSLNGGFRLDVATTP